MTLKDKIREKRAFWIFPAALILVCVLILSIQITLGARKKTNTSIKNYNPEWNRTSSSEESTKAQSESGSPKDTGQEKPVIYLQDLLKDSSLSGGQNETLEFTNRNASVVFKVYGRAHGVGLCMDGVKYMALSGKSYMEIINYYYTGVTLSHADDSREIRVRGRDGKIRTMTMKDYLYHLTEEPESFPPEGLKVLYVAARTYTLSCIERGKHASQGFDVCASGGCCQAFDENKDLSKYPRNIAAVNETSGEILTYNGKPIVAAYCGSCGGHTENNEDVWGGKPLPYLRGKVDEFCRQSPNFCKEVRMSVSELERKLNSSPKTSVGKLNKLDISSRTPGGRVKNAIISGTSGTKKVSGQTIAKVLGFNSTRFEYSIK
ncbi:MAG: SpoIID/LytB domain-containing protein [Actinomycetota bacterium]|nr:SpoIID/LytB domain-containing protein [Actinomycetota bacterium]